MECKMIKYMQETIKYKIYARVERPCMFRNMFDSLAQMLLTFLIYSCFDKGCPMKLKHTSQRLLIVIVYCYLIELHGVSARRRGKYNTHVRTVFFYHVETPFKATITHNTFRHCRVRLYAFVGQPFSKQLYSDILSY